jgi:phage terminase small subunit
MPTPRKTIAELVLSGTYQQNKKRYESRLAPQATVQLPVGRAPSHLLATERAIWAEVVKSAPEGLLGRPDRLIVEVACKFIARMRSSDLKVSELNALVNVLAKLGMDPHSRKKMHYEPPVKVDTAVKGDAWDELDELDE